MKKNCRGMSLIELLIYVALLATILLVTFELFLITSLARLSSFNDNAIYLNAQRILFDLGQTIRGASSIDSPPLNNSGPSLSLNGGTIIYALDGNGSLTKNENTEINKLSSQEVVVENLVFQTLGPSTKQPTVKISFTLRAVSLEQGKTRKENFQTAVSLR